MRGYVRTSRNTGVSVGPGLGFFGAIAFVAFVLPLLFLKLLAQIGVAFLKTTYISGGLKLVIGAMIGCGTLLAVLGHGSHCDLAGYCHQSRGQIALSVIGVIGVVVALVVALVGCYIGAYKSAARGGVSPSSKKQRRPTADPAPKGPPQATATGAPRPSATSSGSTRAVLGLPLLPEPLELPSPPALRLTIDLADPPPEPSDVIEVSYMAGLTAIQRHEDRRALEHLRAVVSLDDSGAYSTAMLLTLLCSALIGDIDTMRVLIEPCSTATNPDTFALGSITSCGLEMFMPTNQDPPSIRLSECLHQPELAAQVALAACLLATDKEHDACEALEAALHVRALRDDAWRARTPADRSSGRAGGPIGIEFTLCDLYLGLGELDKVLDVVGRHSFFGDRLCKGWALKYKGLTDAALTVYDDAIRDYKREGISLEHEARYLKAGLLIETGNLASARRELARLYADNPMFDDRQGLLEKVKAPRDTPRREPIAEEVRHAVWRRDQGHCVSCGSQENLEFDHVIPVSKGGSNTERNLQLLCERCNRVKAADI